MGIIQSVVIECPKKNLSLYLLDCRSSVYVTHFGLAALFLREVQVKCSGISKDIGNNSYQESQETLCRGHA